MNLQENGPRFKRNPSSSSNVENDDENHHELLRYSGRMKNKEVEPTMKNNLKSILENIGLMKFILTSNFKRLWESLRIN